MVENEQLAEYIREGREFRDTVIAFMAAGTVQNQNFLDYVKKCDSERKDYGKRITDLEKTRSIQNGIIAAFISVATLVGTAFEIFRKS